MQALFPGLPSSWLSGELVESHPAGHGSSQQAIAGRPVERKGASCMPTRPVEKRLRCTPNEADDFLFKQLYIFKYINKNGPHLQGFLRCSEGPADCTSREPTPSRQQQHAHQRSLLQV
ncbi:uncharacterized protein LOC144151926 [Haemaphysalis longicornis]